MSPKELFQKLKEKRLISPTSEVELTQLWRLAFDAGRFHYGKPLVELGTLNAISALVLADAIKQATSHVPEILPPGIIRTVDSYTDHAKHPSLHSYQQNVELVRTFGHDDVIDVIESDSIEYLKSLEDKSAGLVFEDSWHAEEHVRPTLEIALTKLAPNGLVVCHDYCYAQYGVMYAVQDILLAAPNFGGSGLCERLWWGVMR